MRTATLIDWQERYRRATAEAGRLGRELESALEKNDFLTDFARRVSAEVVVLHHRIELLEIENATLRMGR